MSGSLVLAAVDPAALARVYGALLNDEPQPGRGNCHRRVPWPAGGWMERSTPHRGASPSRCIEEPMGLRGAMKVSNGPLYQELARRIGLQRMDEAIQRLHDGNEQIGTNVTTFWLREPLAISAIEQARFLSALAHRALPIPDRAQRQVAEITRVDSGHGWSLPAKTGWQNAPGAGVGWWVGWVQRGVQITPFALNIAMSGAADAPKRERLGRSSLQALGILPTPPRGPGPAH